MSVGILTFHNANNYGAELQAYALRTTIDGLGCDVELVDYRCPSVTANEHPHLLGPAESLAHPVLALYRLAIYPGLLGRWREFERFRREHQSYGPHITDPGELAERYETVVVGSDQVWNPEITRDDGMFLLEGVEEGSLRRVAYAASFGYESISPAWAERCNRALPAFFALSTREHEGARIVEDVVGRTAKVVLDPTLLPDRAAWERVAAPRAIEGDYVFCYIVLEREATLRAARGIARRLSLELVVIDCGLPIRRRGCRDMSQASPETFLSLVRHARLVVTSSFHGLALSLALGTEARYVLSGDARNKNSRIRSLARTARVEGWEITSSQSAAEALEADAVDFDEIDAALQIAREDSLGFLADALEGASL